jgi:16S rRNA (cytosine967-C5)-methyltransferase
MTASPHKQSRDLSSQKISARRLAYSILLRVETEGAYASELLHRLSERRLDATTDERDAALTTELVLGTLRWQRLIDFFIERYTKRQTSALDREVLIVLRLGIYQLRHLTRIPSRAAVNETVELAKQARKKSAAALVNAALRKAAAERELPTAKLLPPEMETADGLALKYSHPTWLVERWIRNSGEQETTALLQSNNRPPEQACVFLKAAHRDEAIESLQDDGVMLEAGHLLRDAMIVRSGSLRKTSAFQNGWIGMQDEASQLVPLLLDAKSGETTLDLCAAPGGKTMILASRVGPEGQVVAADLRETRLQSMRARIAGLDARNILLVALDGTRELPFACQFDRVLVDAPCSGTGTLARNPEIRWRLRPEDLTDLHERQVKLVRSALARLAPAGALLYSTCSLEPEENEQVVREVLSSEPQFRGETVKIPHGIVAARVNSATLVCEDGAFRTFPPQHGTDGFFAALIRRK